ncbi:MAG TPA: hypothetical protein VFS24_11365 [Steroidobacteraceae bacterium]|nr:hypothetical protein [Steroidobacteraceae bacterium]
MRTVTVSLGDTELDGSTETLLFTAIANLERHCDSLLRCRVNVERGGRASGHSWRVTMLLSSSERDIFVEGMDDAMDAPTPRTAILNAIRQAEGALMALKRTKDCTTCCEQLPTNSPPPRARRFMDVAS